MKFFPSEFLEELLRALFDNSIQFSQNFHAFGSNVAPNHPAILRIALLAKEFLCLEPAEQASYVRFRGNHHPADSGTGEPAGTRRSQNPQDIELSQGEAGWLEPLLHGAMQVICRAHEVEQRLLVGTGEASGLPRCR